MRRISTAVHEEVTRRLLAGKRDFPTLGTMLREVGRRLSPSDVANHLACQHHTQLEPQRRSGGLKVLFAPNARLEAMLQRGQEHERVYVTRLHAVGQHVVDLTGWRDPVATVAAMRSGADVSVQAPLGSDRLFGVADVLLRIATLSTHGAHSYEPVDTKLAAGTKAGAMLQLPTCCELLGVIQGTLPAPFRVVTPSTEETYRTSDHTAHFRVIRNHLQGAVAAEPPPATYPEPVPHCDVCAYWQHCQKAPPRRRPPFHATSRAASAWHTRSIG